MSGPLSRYRLNNLGFADWDAEEDRIAFLSTPSQWHNFQNMASVEFALSQFPEQRDKDQFLALGDNSPQSKDSRLWAPRMKDFFVERELLIGKALAIYWPITHFRLVR